MAKNTTIVIIIIAAIFLVLIVPMLLDKIQNPPRPIVFPSNGATINESQLIKDLLITGQWSIDTDFSDWVATTNGSAFTIRTPRGMDISTGASAGSAARTNHTSNTGWSSGELLFKIDWSKEIVLVLFLYNRQFTPNGVSRFTLGKSLTDGLGDLSNKGIGIKIENNALKGTIHNGSTLTDIDLNTNLGQDITTIIVIHSFGNGLVSWSLCTPDCIVRGESLNGPIGISLDNQTIRQLEVQNTTDAAIQRTGIAQIGMFVEQ